jgi:hypothetical protein
MNANALLYWMSARGQGSWQQFRTAVEELELNETTDIEGEDDDAPDEYALPLYQTLRFNLQRLGHAEFFAGAGTADWRVTPPSLAMTQRGSEWLGIVAGARSLALLNRIHGAAGNGNIVMRSMSGYPDQLLFVGTDRAAIASVAERAGLAVQDDAPAALLASLPAVDDGCVRHLTQLPFGADWKVERFSCEVLGWRAATLSDAQSATGDLFRFSLLHQRHVLFCGKGGAFRIPGQAGKYLALRGRRRQVFSYDASAQVLSVPGSCRPPFLVERALILCSGVPPTYEGNSRTGTLSYADIPHGVAALAAGLLRQELR